MSDAVDNREAMTRIGGRPSFSADDARAFLAARWGLDGDVSALESERDQNWRLIMADGSGAVLKIANRGEPREVLDLQRLLMQLLAAAGLPCPAVIPAADGSPVLELDGHQAWVIGLLPGAKLADVPEPTDALLHDVGAVLGRARLAIADFDHPAAHREIQWDVVHADRVLTAYRPSVAGERGRLIDEALDEFRRHVVPVLSALPRAVVHNDANDHNILVAGDRVSGLIDFGDAVHTIAVNDLAIACAYAMLNKSAPWGVCAPIVQGYTEHCSLTADEAAALPHLIRTRLATSVSISAYQQTLAPDDDYLRVSEGPVWRLLADIAEGHR